MWLKGTDSESRPKCPLAKCKGDGPLVVSAIQAEASAQQNLGAHRVRKSAERTHPRPNPKPQSRLITLRPCVTLCIASLSDPNNPKQAAKRAASDRTWS